MAAMPSSPVPSSEPAALSEGARIVDTFVAPSKTFTDLRRSAAWWAPWLLMVIVGVAFAYVVDVKVGYPQVIENQIAKSSMMQRQVEGLSPDARAANIQKRAAVTRVIYFALPALSLIFIAIFAGIYYASFKFGANADLTYGLSFAVVVYAALPEVLRGLLAMVTLFAGAAPDSFNIQNPVATNLGAFFDQATSPFLYTMGSSLDIFRLWSIALTAIGFAYAGKVKLGVAFAIVIGWFVLATLVFSGLATLGS